jgi:hypothetical protein
MRSILFILLLTAQVKAFSQSNLKSMNNYLKETPILNFSDSSITGVLQKSGFSAKLNIRNSNEHLC